MGPGANGNVLLPVSDGHRNVGIDVVRKLAWKGSVIGRSNRSKVSVTFACSINGSIIEPQAQPGRPSQ